MQRTQNYNLCQWAAEDRILRSDFNADNQKIDAALGALASAGVKFVCGTYVGDGAETRTIPLDFTPRVVYLCDQNSQVYYAGSSHRTYKGGLFTPEAPIKDEYNRIVQEIVDHGFTVRCSEDTSHYNTIYCFSNENGQTYRYVALG